MPSHSRFISLSIAALAVPAFAARAQIPAKSPESPLLATLARDAATSRPAVVETFWRVVADRKTPLVDSLPGDTTHVLATFVFRGSADTREVVLVAGPNGVAPFTDPRSHMRRLPGTDVWYVSHRLARDAEFLYQFSVNPPQFEGDPQPGLLRPTMTGDTLNPLRYPESTDAAPSAAGSIARMPAVPANPWLAVRRDVIAGTVRDDTIASAILAGSRRVWTYASPGASLDNANLLILFDGGIYINRIPTPTILDNLYAGHRIRPTVAVFVDNGGAARATDYYFSDTYSRFLVEELVPWIRRRFGFTPDRARTVLGGSSLGGLTAAYAALRRPDVFGKVISESGAFWPNGRGNGETEPEWFARQIALAPRSDVEFYVEVGSHESTMALQTTLLASNRHLRDILQLKGYRLRYVETPGNHEPVHWRRALPDALIAMLGG